MGGGRGGTYVLVVMVLLGVAFAFGGLADAEVSPPNRISPHVPLAMVMDAFAVVDV